MIVALIGVAGPAAADDLVSNLAEGSSGIGVILSESDIAMPFTTGTNASGYQLESISLNFRTGRSREYEPVYVYLYGDHGNGSPNDRDQIATPTINGPTFEGPVAGVNKYTVRKYGRPAPFNASSVHLDANTRYWVFVWAGEDKTLVHVDTTGPLDTGAAGWSIGDSGLVKPQGSADSNYTGWFAPLKMKVEGYAKPRGADLDQRRHGDRGCRRDGGLRRHAEQEIEWDRNRRIHHALHHIGNTRGGLPKPKRNPDVPARRDQQNHQGSNHRRHRERQRRDIFAAPVRR